MTMLRLSIAASLALACATVVAAADSLPGVTPSDAIVQPMPEPLDQPQTENNTAIKVGDWDVKVSGSVVVDVGTGKLRSPRR